MKTHHSAPSEPPKLLPPGLYTVQIIGWEPWQRVSKASSVLYYGALVHVKLFGRQQQLHFPILQANLAIWVKVFGKEIARTNPLNLDPLVGAWGLVEVIHRTVDDGRTFMDVRPTFFWAEDLADDASPT